MTNNHPITPTPELLEQWEAETAHTTKDEAWHIAVQAARWGADQELEACVNYIDNTISGNKARALRAARRPKPPSLKEQALKALDDISIASFEQDAANTIRHALEQLND